MIRSLIFSIALIITFINSGGAQTYMEKVQQHRKEMDEEFADTSRSILPDSVISTFHGLPYFEIDPNYLIKAKFKKIKKGKVVILKTSGVKTKQYRPYGTLSFKLNNRKCKLTLYQNADPSRPDLKDYLLLAFTDKTNGFESYGGGRYLDYRIDDVKEEMILDFNYCYNPYCAYTDGYNCVIPPAENALSIEIKAGAKKWHD